MVNKFTLLALVVPTLTWTVASHAAPTKQPNVLIIVADDLGYSDSQPFGGEISTPNLTKLAKSGTVLTNFYAGPTCSVTRSMLLTGNDNHQAGLGSMAEFLQPEQKNEPGYEGRLNNKVVTLAELLKPQGYATFATGKWHLGGTPDSNPKARGFDRSFMLMPGGASHMDMKQMFPGNYKARYLEDGKEASIPEDFYSSDFYATKMLSYLQNDRQKGQPFLGYLAFSAPHWPLQAPDSFLKKYEGRYQEGYEKIRQARIARMKQLGIVPKNTQINNPLDGTFPTWDKLTPAQKQEQIKTMQVYAAMVDSMDHNIGRVLDYLKKTGEMDNTLILFMSDNGAESAVPESLGTNDEKQGIRQWVDSTFDNSFANMGKKGSYVTLGPQWAQVSSTPYPYFKSLVSNGGIHVPAIIHYPKNLTTNTATKIKPGKINTQTIHVMDVVPTILEMTGAKRPDTVNGNPVLPMEGRSFLPVLAGKPLPERALGWEFNNRRALYKGDWTAQLQTPPYGTDKWELYNRKLDPSLRNNLATQNPEKTAELAKDWDDYAKRVGVVPAPIRYIYGQRTCFYDKCIQPGYLQAVLDSK